MIRAFAFALLILPAVPIALAAQTAPERPAISKSDLAVGYSYLVQNYQHTQLNRTTGGMSGWNMEYAVPLQPGSHWGLMFNGAGYYAGEGLDGTTQIYFTMIGPRYAMAVGGSTLELRGLVGSMFASGFVIAQTSSKVRPIFGAGGAWDFRARRRLAWRVGFDWIYGGFNSNDTNQISQIVRNNGRLSVGPVWRF
jgi:hypothetical protein